MTTATQSTTAACTLERKWQVTLAAGLGLMAIMYLPLNLDTVDWLMPAIFVVASVIQFWAAPSTPRRGRPRSTAPRT